SPEPRPRPPPGSAPAPPGPPRRPRRSGDRGPVPAPYRSQSREKENEQMTDTATEAPESGGASDYLFDNHSEHAFDQHRFLAAAYDPMTTERLAETGVGPGWRCLEVGAGGGSVARWLAERVAPGGSVLATDIKPERIPAAEGLEVRRHDIVRDPLPEAAYDLVHARLVLLHLAGRGAAARRVRHRLRAGAAHARPAGPPALRGVPGGQDPGDVRRRCGPGLGPERPRGDAPGRPGRGGPPPPGRTLGRLLARGAP